MTVLNFDWNNNNRSGLHKDTDKISLLQLPAYYLGLLIHLICMYQLFIYVGYVTLG